MREVPLLFVLVKNQVSVYVGKRFLNSEGRSDIGIPSLALGSCLCAVVKPDAGTGSDGSECPPHLATAPDKWQVTPAGDSSAGG